MLKRCRLRQAPISGAAFDKNAAISALQGETNLERHLPMTDFAVFDVSARLGYLKPPHVADGFLSACQRIRYRVLKSVR